MKKEKAKTQSKKTKKELENKLETAFTAIVAEYGKTKKTKSIIEKFAKQLSKKVDFKSKPTIVTEEVAPLKEKVVKAKPAKKIVETAE